MLTRALRIVRGLIGFIAGFQVITLLPALTWPLDVSAVTVTMVAAMVIKVVVLLIALLIFYWLQRVINERHRTRFGFDHPALADNRWGL